MELGTRCIRSSGAGSGSIELTLPASLRELQGLACRITLRDGRHPEIVLQPELRGALAAFRALAARLHGALGLPPEAPELETRIASLHPIPSGAGVARLAWTDGLALAGPPPQKREALARSLRALAEPAGVAAGLGEAWAPGFAAALAWLLTGLVPEAAEQRGCDIVAAALLAEGLRPAPPALAADAFADADWDAATPMLGRLLALHRGWTAAPARHAALAAGWRRGLAAQLRTG
ncbi:hypothetical protein JYK14_21635 [Siccirubricoccus sp. KC 17139]|uniref:DUF2877 domain-containing protein n=1 Tax=Siccirubricoccus soli TaxID=2899147 RepID=A0ABT1DCS0_9PROT|nr:hypothetical protein [Siccirubricoccus soli]MCO6418740.1 hypothetical protein [Siccirubricoccus soli]MCP2684875.1 hypothetical protein [Siccirubricoccus soli]